MKLKKIDLGDLPELQHGARVDGELVDFYCESK